MASLDAARRQLVIHGQALLSRTIAASNRARKIIDGTTACRVVGRELVGHPGVAGWDPLRIVVDVRPTGCSGYEVAAALRSAYDVHVELATHATMVLVLGLGQPADALDRFTHDFATTVRRIERPGDAEALVRASGALVNEVVVPPREAFLGEAETVPVADAVGRVSAESIAGYPPGIPALLPGRADHRRGRSATCASCASRARACTARATRTSAPSSCSATPPDLSAAAVLSYCRAHPTSGGSRTCDDVCSPPGPWRRSSRWGW